MANCSYRPIKIQPGLPKEDEFPVQEGGSRTSGQEIPMQQISESRILKENHTSDWMPVPATATQNVLPGLEYLKTIDHLFISQKVELLEAFTGIETNNKYVVLNTLGQKVYYAKEDNDFCTRWCLGKLRPFEMSIFDNSQQEIIHISRPYACMDCCFPCCLQKMEVSAPAGNAIGFIEQDWSFCTPLFRVLNAQNETVLKIKGPVITCSCCEDVNFQILSADGTTPVGKISKHWSGFSKEMFTDADNFGIEFPVDLNVEIKATLLAANFLIDFMYFQKEPSANDR